jgi:hypothetical protein
MHAKTQVKKYETCNGIAEVSESVQGYYVVNSGQESKSCYFDDNEETPGEDERATILFGLTWIRC